ncbi:hypothetical protein JCM13664_22020 [Methylothermus subterraneus]
MTRFLPVRFRAELMLFVVAIFGGFKVSDATTVRSEISYKTAHLLIPFVPNQGQTQKEIAFYADAFWGKAIISQQGNLGYLIPNGKDKDARPVFLVESVVGGKVRTVRGEGKLPTKIHYFKSGQTVRNLPAYQRVSLGEVYPGIELSMQVSGASAEKIFKVMPLRDPKAICLRLEGAHKLSVNTQGELEVETGAGRIVFSKPIAYQELQGQRREVQIAYRLKGGNEYGFVLGNYDRTQEVIIDPVLAKIYVGGSSGTAGRIAVNAQGNVYVAGSTQSSDALAFPGPYNPNGFDTTFNERSDIFILKLDPDLTTMLAGTYFGGSNYDYLGDMTLDDQGNVYITGYGYSMDIPTTGTAYDRTGGGGKTDVFVAQFDPDLGGLLASTYLGGAKGHDQGLAIAVDKASGDVIVAGLAGSTGYPGKPASTDFPTTPGAFDTTFSGSCTAAYRKTICPSAVFVSRFDNNLTQLKASTFLDGTSSETAYALEIGNDGDIYLTGSTASSNFPVTSNAYDKTYGGGGGGYTAYQMQNPLGDVFVTRLSSNLSVLKASTLLGGGSKDFAYGLALDNLGNVFVSGWTDSTDFPTTLGAFDAVPGTFGVYDGFVAKLDGNLTALLASTFLGAGGNDGAGEVAFDSFNANILVIGQTQSGDFFLTPTTTSTSAAFVARLDANSLGLIEGEVFGLNTGLGSGRSVALAPDSTPYVAGSTSTPGGSLGWVVKLGSIDLDVTLTDAPDPVAIGETLSYLVRVTNNGPNLATNVVADFTLPDLRHFSFVSATSTHGNCTFTGASLSCNLGALGVGASTSIQVIVTPTQDGTLTMGVQVSGSEPDRYLTNNSASAITTVTGGNTGGGGQGGGGGGTGTADLTVSATDTPDPAPFNALVTYDLTVSNQGPDAATNVVLTQEFGNSFVLNAAAASQGSCSLSGMRVSCSLGNLASGATASAQITVRFSGDGGMASEISATAQETDPNPGDNSIQVETEILSN